MRGGGIGIKYGVAGYSQNTSTTGDSHLIMAAASLPERMIDQ